MENKMLTFKKLLTLVPKEIKELLDKCKLTPQSKFWHSEGPNEKIPHNVLFHIKIVYNRALKNNDINLIIASIFHDLGKAETTTPSKKTPGNWNAYGHEFISVKLVTKHKDWIESMGGNLDIIYDIVLFHMKVKLIDEMRPEKRKKLEENPNFKIIKEFSELDNMKTLTEEELNL